MPVEEHWISVSDLQRRLAQKAMEEPEHRFGGLYDLLTWETVLDEAAKRLLAHKGSRTPGLDRLDRRGLMENRDRHQARLVQQLREGTFQPNPVKRIYIPKKNGKMRPLGIPTLYDRWVQMAIKLILEPIFESDFLDFSHGFRPRRSCHTAIAHVVRLTTIRKRKVYWVIEGDIEGFFDHVHHKKLMSLLRRRIRDKQLLDLIWRFLRAGLMEQGLFTRTKEGTPQGGVLSPLLANIYLSRFDAWFAERAMLGNGYARTRHRKAGHANFQMVRYADDFLVFSNGTKLETEAFKAEMKMWLADELKLTLSEEKTAITHYTDGVNFLGFTLKKTPSRSSGEEVVVNYPSTESVQRAIRHITGLTGRTDVFKSREDKIDALNRFLRGWGEYFRHSSASRTLSYVEHHTYLRVWKWLFEKEGTQHGWRRIKAKYERDHTWQVGKHRLFRLKELKIEYPTLHKPFNPFLGADPVPEPYVVDLYAAAWTGYHDYGEDWKPARDAAWLETEGKCAICGEPAEDVHHITAKLAGGGNVTANLVLLCHLHHQEAGRRNSAVSQQIASEAKPGSGELGARKRARPVRGEGL